MLQEPIAKWFTLEEVADDVGGLPDEIGAWIASGELHLVDPDAAHDGQICEEDFRRIERHQIELDIRRLFENPDAFLDTPFERFDGKSPRQLLQTPDAVLVRDIVWQMKAGSC